MKNLLYTLLAMLALVSCSKEEEVVTPPTAKQYTLTISAEAGGTVSTEGGLYNEGSKITVTATPDDMYLFKEWSDGSTQNPREITVTSNLTLKASFIKKTYSLAVTVEGEGTVAEEVIIQGSTTETEYNAGTTVRLTATPNEGWVFAGWSGDVQSTDNPIEVSIEKGMSINALFDKLEIISIEILNPIDSLVISTVHKFQVEGTYSNGTKIDLSDEVEFESLNENITLLDNNQFTVARSGLFSIEIKYQDFEATTDLTGIAFEFVDVPEQLKVNANNELIIPVIILSYLPTVDGVNLDLKRAPDGYWNLYNSSLEQSKDKILNESIVSRRYWEEGSKFRGFQNSSSESYIGIEVVSYINIYEMDFNPIGDGSGKKIDYFSLFEKLNLREIVEGKGVKEIWFNHYPLYDSPVVSNHPELYSNRNDFWGLDESNMSSPTTGDISNSSRENDLPIYNSTYVVYAFNQRNGFGNHIHCRGHQIEAQLSFIENGVIYPSGPIAESSLFLGEFVGITNNNGGWLFQPGKVGRVHNPPNTYDDEQYGYSIDRVFSSNILDWKPNGGETSLINHTLWNSIEYGDDFYFYNYIGGQPNTSETNWLLFWFQSIPGYQNNIPYEKDGVEYTLTNWWDLIYNWDEAVTQGKTLWE